jgi:hypothetical protein
VNGNLSYHAIPSMNRLSSVRYSLNQRVSAVACLLALLLTFAPVASATLMTLTGTCCNGDQCPIHGNQHSAPQSQNAGSDCDHYHHQDAMMTGCSMSCCHSETAPAVHAHIFVFAPEASFPNLAMAGIAPNLARLLNTFRNFAPLSPPPENLVSQNS